MVERKGGTVALKRVTDAISKVQAGTDKTAAELAITRMETECRTLEQQREALILQSKAERDAAMKSVLIIALVSFVLGYFINTSLHNDVESPSGLAIIVLAMAIGIGIGLYIKLRRNERTNARLNDGLDDLDSRLSAKREKLARNRAIADS